MDGETRFSYLLQPLAIGNIELRNRIISLITSLRGRVPELYGGGDCITPRRMESIVKEGARLARPL